MPLRFILRFLTMDYTGTKFCANDDELQLGGRLCRFPGTHLRWTTQGSLPNFDHLSLVACGEAAWKMITDVCGLTTEYVSNPKTAHALTNFGRIDGRGNVLAWSKVFCGANMAQADQLFDTSEAFVFATGGIPSNKISLPATWCHENIHLVGLNGHLGRGNLMADTYDPSILSPRSGDIAELVSRFGLPKASDSPMPVPIPSPVPAIPGGSSVMGILKAVLDIFRGLDPQERKDLIQLIITLVNLFKGMSASEKQQFLEVAEHLKAELKAAA